MTEKRFTVCTFPKGSFENVLEDNLTGDAFQFTNEYHRSICELLNKLNDENEQLKKSKKGQELEIVRLHHLADALSGALRELGIYDVYNKKQLYKVKKELQRND